MPMMKWPLGLSTAGFEPANVAEHLDLFTRQAVRHVEIFIRGPESYRHFDYHTPQEVKRLAQLLVRHGMTSSLHAPFVDFCVPEPDQRQAAVQELTLAMNVATELGVTILVMHANAKELMATETYLEELQRLLVQAKCKGLRLAVENGASRATNVQAIVNMVKHVHHRSLGICLDTSHVCLAEGADKIGETVALCANSLITLHVSDGDRQADRHWVPGDPRGQIDWQLFLTALAAADYPGIFMCEPVEGQSTREGIEDLIRRTVQQVESLFTKFNSKPVSTRDNP